MPHKIAISRRELHLAAYVKAHGAELTSYVNGNFYFLSDIPESDWRVEHAGSDALRVDQELLALRRFVV
ncbi:hypothetical protein UFOVP35_13 [uncultured Caudovirales phage]|uniref:Uncharacterized protein n=1 Tax=uncultured Caudovirales phage TaxID=2100421 RepID=A0A6J5KL01_9CAUD|nr:hypothetical protein UFOVP35_13 [uncultured Caudovirales phage]CAB4124545.1 hypothetical protein UFOVP52_34 [uncultured Caudovirales phage]CAB5219881.1 hypothetical protein UFOVP234_59 [uncultured Caudovirales phage]